MVRQTREQLLEDLRRNRRNRTLEEAQEVLRLYGFSSRPSAKEQGGVWKRGNQTLTLPKPHGRDRVLGKTYIRFVLEAIDAAEAEDALKNQDEGLN